MTQARQKIAVIGAGISGLASAYFLAREHDVVVYEAGSYIGGHTNTVDVTLEGLSFPVDTGFLVFNEATYPNLISLLDELGVDSYTTDMSFGVSLDDGGFEWAGTSLDTVFAQRRRLLSPAFLGMLRDILRFNRAAESNLAASLDAPVTLEQLLAAGSYGAMFRDAYLLPMAAAIWSSAPADILQFPAATFLRFCLNHGLLQVNDRPQWRTVKGGAREYVRKITATLPAVRLNTEVLTVLRSDDAVTVRTHSGYEQFDSVVFATHAPDTLHMLTDADAEERALLSAVRYQANTAYLHTDLSLMPQRRKVWSSWNYLGAASAAQDGARAVCVSYWLNQLQALPCKSAVMVTLNPFSPPAADKTIAKFDYDHPVFDQAAIAAQNVLAAIQGKRRTWFAGAWTGYGFHEDGLKSALRVVADFGVAPLWAKV
ncbi:MULTISPECIES: FAD-dependent oxidoreductase [unclassified Herbaspirillum]|nr:MULTISPECIES: FAD-dependent oxidoreductase [unclassified Herbaspirillum]RFB67045.1 FAD-dependent oxidoreductase [Herbaspirillum sp. 3R-3a1]TFI06083.1 FAD-dependent oxidoreductase [Herbaspirillum sp. 3R11]TFI14305.1 FAD-dependent oxidoreductase [Herbaspirillum sp. 3R-11]